MEKSKFAGRTVNERLYVSGLMDDFDKAVQEKDVERVKDILRKVELEDTSIIQILESLNLENSK